jgi:hypothetical protein
MRRAALLLLSIFAAAIRAQDAASKPRESIRILPELELYADADTLALGPAGALLIDGAAFSGATGFRFVGDGAELPTESWMPEGYYMSLNPSWMRLALGDFVLSGGYRVHAHSLSRNPLNVLHNPAAYPFHGLDLRYEGGFLRYETRWSGLVAESRHNYPYSTLDIETGDPIGANSRKWADRGLASRMVALDFGKLRVAYEEASIYLERYFDPGYFLIPAPSILINTLWSNQSLNPWARATNDASLMGFYADYEDGDVRLEGQFLIKDITFSQFGIGYPNVNKFAWSLGAELATEAGAFSLWHGGATKHMYAASYQSASVQNAYPYQYAAYPVSSIAGRPLPLEKNNLGFVMGENALALELGWRKDFRGLGPFALVAEASLRYCLRGEQSLENPWHESLAPEPPATHLFTGESVLESSLIMRAGGRLEWAGAYAALDIALGAAFNALRLSHAADGGADIWKPQAGVVDPLSSLRLRAGYSFSL